MLTNADQALFSIFRCRMVRVQVLGESSHIHFVGGKIARAKYKPLICSYKPCQNYFSVRLRLSAVPLQWKNITFLFLLSHLKVTAMPNSFVRSQYSWSTFFFPLFNYDASPRNGPFASTTTFVIRGRLHPGREEQRPLCDRIQMHRSKKLYSSEAALSPIYTVVLHVA